MKTSPLPLLLLPALALLAFTGCSTTSTKGGGTVTVQFEEGVRITDFGRAARDTPYSLAQEKRQLEDVLIDLADTYIPEGCNVRLVISGLDRAGVAMPTSSRPVRVISDRFPARAAFQYFVTGATGEALRHGNETLYLNLSPNPRSPAGADSAMPDMDDLFRPWFRQLGKQLPRSLSE